MTADRYPFTSRALHWLTAIALVAQFTVGYLLDVDDSGRGRGRGRGRSGESGQGRGRGRGGDADLGTFGDDALFTTHVVLGATIFVLALTRLWWRRRGTLPPWAPGLSRTEQAIVHWNERLLYLSLVVMPASGLWLVLVSDDALPAHITSHIVFFVALTVHLGIVATHQIVRREHIVRRML